MSNTIIIGTQGTQPFAISDPRVSRRHAVLNITDGGQMFLIDTSSTNGTFVYNGSVFVRLYPNQPYVVTPDTMIQLGPETRFHVRKLLQRVGALAQSPGNNEIKLRQAAKGESAGKNPKRVDISNLRKVSEVYEGKKMHIDSKIGMINGLRGLTILITLIAGAVGTFLTQNSSLPETSEFGMDPKTLIVLFVAIILTVLLQYYIHRYNKNLIRQRKDNEHTYAVKYVCPECHVSFRGKIYENILAERCCPRCKTQYYDKNEEKNK